MGAVREVMRLKEQYPGFVRNRTRALELMAPELAPTVTADCPARRFDSSPLWEDGRCTTPSGPLLTDPAGRHPVGPTWTPCLPRPGMSSTRGGFCDGQVPLEVGGQVLEVLTNERWGFESNCFVCEPRNDAGRGSRSSTIRRRPVTAEFTLDWVGLGCAELPPRRRVLLAASTRPWPGRRSRSVYRWAVTGETTTRFDRAGRPDLHGHRPHHRTRDA